ncbi:MAG: Txe/YoeB family addiction module toxin [Candidatus Kapabacteria bacterium]|nr:Txe/YoeB family addiction module toxin [Candidatus Kapabacteria bacterium]
MNILFEQEAFEELQEWVSTDKKVFKKIVELIRNISRSPYEGLGKPEPLKYNYGGYWSRRITQEDRLIYKIDDSTIVIISCKGHYD